MEIVTDERGQRVRVAEDGASNRDSIAGVATAEAVVAGLFGFDPTFRDPVGVPLPSSIEMPGIGSLANINVPAGINATAGGDPSAATAGLPGRRRRR